MEPLQPRGTFGAAPQTQRDDGRIDRLEGWKAIAAYLGRDIRTVQRWELSEQLPVHRLGHKRQGSAYAYASELNEWRARRSIDHALHPVPETPRVGRWRLWLFGLGAALLLATLLVVTIAQTGGSSRAYPLRGGGETVDAEAFAAYAEGRALYAARQYAAAIASLEHAVARDAKYGSAWALLAKAHARLAQPVWAGGVDAAVKAAEAARRAVEVAPGAADTHVALSLAARSRGDLATWRAEAQRAVDLDGRAAEAYALLGDSYSSVVYACSSDQDPERAEAYYRRALELMPDLTTAISNRAGNLRRMGRYTECVDLLNRAIHLFRDDTPLRATRGGCRLMLGDVAGATEDIGSLRNNPRIAPTGAMVYFGFLALKSGDTAEGIRNLEAFAAHSPGAKSELIVAEVYGIVGDLPRTVAHLRRAFTMDPSCAGMVNTSLAFRTVRDTSQVRQLLSEYGTAGRSERERNQAR
jgi:tetratricopeptide (TPR) repeat protein